MGLKTNLVSLNFFIWFTQRKAIENAKIIPCIKRADASRHKADINCFIKGFTAYAEN